MEYWHDLVTEKSWKILQDIKGRFDFIVIGGWAAYLWTRMIKSKDIDIIIGIEQLDYLKRNYDVKKNENLKKYEIIIDNIDIDIYVPHYSRLPIPAEEIKKYTSKIEGFTVPRTEILLALKLDAEKSRSESEKGLKDRIDIMSILLKTGVDFRFFMELLKKYKKDALYMELVKTVKNFREYGYLGLKPNESRKSKEEIIRKMREI